MIIRNETGDRVGVDVAPTGVRLTVMTIRAAGPVVADIILADPAQVRAIVAELAAWVTEQEGGHLCETA